MKRYVMLVLFLSITMFLTACDLTGEEEEILSEAFCRANPNSSICEGDILEDLTEDAIETLFWDIEEDYSESKEDFCETYFSVSNIALLDECKDTSKELFPDDLEGYEIDTIQYDEEYIVTLIKDDNSMKYIFHFVLIVLEGTTYVEEWSFTGQEPDPIVCEDGYVLNEETNQCEEELPVVEEIPLQKATELASEFMNNYQDASQTNATVCAKYYPDNIDTCVTEREIALNAGLLVTSSELIKVLDKYTYTVKAEYGMYYLDTEDELEVEYVFEDEEWNIVVQTIWPGPTEVYYPEEEIYRDAFNDYVNATFPDEVCEQLFVGDMFDECVLFHQKINAHEIDVSITSFELGTSGFDVEYTFTDDEGTTTEIIPMYMSDVGVDVEITQPFPNIAPFTEEQMMMLLIERLNEPFIDACYNDMNAYGINYCDTFETNIDNGDLLWELIRTEVRDDITEVTIRESDVDGAETHKDLDIEFTQDESGWYFNIIYSFDLMSPETHYLYRFLYPMVNELNNTEITDEEYCDIYGAYYFDCYHVRAELLGLEYSAWFVLYEHPDFSVPYELEINIMDHSFEVYDTLLFEFDFDIVDDELLIDGGQIEVIIPPPHEEYYDIFDAFLQAYFDETKTEQDIYNQFNDGMLMGGLYHRDYIITQGITYNIIDITWEAMGYNHVYTATVEFMREGYYDIVDIQYELFPGLSGLNLFLSESVEPLTNEQVGNFITKLSMDYMNEEIASEDFCNHYFRDEAYMTCYDIRHQVIRDDYFVRLKFLSSYEYHVYFDVDFIHPDTTETTLSFWGIPNWDILGNPHLELTVEYHNTALREEFNTYLDDGIVYGFNLHGINLVTFCDEYAVCTDDTFVDINEQIHSVDHFTYWDFFDLRNPELVGVLRFEFMDNDVEHHKYTASYTMDGEYKLWLLHYQGKYYDIPYDAISLDEMVAPSIFDDFIRDFQDEAISTETLSALYFGDVSVFSLSGFMKYRDLVLEDGAVVTATDLDFLYDDMGMLVFTTTVTITFNSYDTYVMEYHVVVMTNPDGYYIVFTY